MNLGKNIEVDAWLRYVDGLIRIGVTQLFNPGFETGLAAFKKFGAGRSRTEFVGGPACRNSRSNNSALKYLK